MRTVPPGETGHGRSDHLLVQRMFSDESRKGKSGGERLVADGVEITAASIDCSNK